MVRSRSTTRRRHESAVETLFNFQHDKEQSMRAAIVVGLSLLVIVIINTAALPVPPAASAPDQPNKTVDSLTKQGYITIKLFRGKSAKYYYVKLKYDTDDEYVFLINSNQPHMSIDLTYAQNRGTSIHARPEPVLNAYGEKKEAYTATGFMISKEFTNLQKSTPGVIYDMTREINDRYEIDAVRYQGVMGNEFLANSGAIIDYENEVLHLLTPFNREKALNGLWDSTEMEFEGNANKHEDLTIEFDGDGLWKWWQKSNNLSCVGSYLLYPRVHPKQMNSSRLDPVSRTNDKLHMIYEVNGDTLKLAGGLKDGVECKETPASFKTKPGDKHAVVTFQRRKPKEK
jgi:uncharacterized protein (TIGR03067 family)